jgi:endonuclease VIII
VPEGDTIFRAARALHHYLAGKTLTRFESVFPALNRVDDDAPLVGRTIDSVTARGKHLLIAFSGDLVLRTHMRMNGSWHLYPPGAPWKRPARDMRLLLATADAVAVGFNVPVAEFLTPRALARHRPLRTLGPDLLAPDFDRAEALRRIHERSGDAIADVLLDQRAIAGIGNVFKCEILFLGGVHPFTRVADLDGSTLERLIDIARDQLTASVMTAPQTLSRAVGRRTTRSLDPNEKLWVYGRGGRPCRRCGAIIESSAAGPEARLTYWCPRCQPPAFSVTTAL